MITSIKKEPAHFLGFEITSPGDFKISKYVRTIKGKSKSVKAITAESEIYCLPDRKRLINRLFMKRYCDAKGFPREIPWRAILEPNMIIERFNCVIQGFANYYAEFVTSQKGLSRWIYIFRYSCLKTLAQKYKISLKGVFKRFSKDVQLTTNTKSKTIAIPVVHKIEDKFYKKTWQLLTQREALINAKKIGRRKRVENAFWSLEGGTPISYPSYNKVEPTITGDNYLDKISWANLRTQASFDLPCSICGCPHSIEMHHLKHIRKNTYEAIKGSNFWERAMSLKNRKQIPVCKSCHNNLIPQRKVWRD